MAANAAAYAAGLNAGDSVTRKFEREAQCRLARCLFRPPALRSPTVDPAWLGWDDGTIVKIAGVVYDDRAFDRSHYWPTPWRTPAARTPRSWRIAVSRVSTS